MGKYDPLRRYLRRRPRGDILLSFDEIERIIGDGLPRAAAQPEWWANEPVEGRRWLQCAAWREAGYRAEPTAGRTVRFRAGL